MKTTVIATENGRVELTEYPNGSWEKYHYHGPFAGKIIYFEDSDGFWEKFEYADGNQVYSENSTGYWWRREYVDGNEVYLETSDGILTDSRETTMSDEEFAKIVGEAMDLSVARQYRKLSPEKEARYQELMAALEAV